MTSWGYARVSTVDQDTAPQFDALRRAGIDEALHVGQDPELVQRGADECDVVVVGVERLRRERVGDVHAGVTGGTT